MEELYLVIRFVCLMLHIRVKYNFVIKLQEGQIFFMVNSSSGTLLSARKEPFARRIFKNLQTFNQFLC